jgi:hypothetical protein
LSTCKGKWVSLSPTNNGCWLGDELGVGADAVAAKLRLVNQYNNNLIGQKYPRVTKRADRFGTPATRWIYVHKCDETPPDLVAYLETRRIYDYRGGQGHRGDSSRKAITRGSHGNQKRRRDGGDNSVHSLKSHKSSHSYSLPRANSGVKGHLTTPTSASSSSCPPQIVRASATLNLDKHQHRGQHAHSEENAIGRQLIAEVKAIAGGLGSQKVHHLLLLAGKYVLRNLDLGKIVELWPASS